MKAAIALVLMMVASPVSFCIAGPYAPPAGQLGSDAVAKDSPLIQSWAVAVESVTRGPINISNPSAGLASFGTPESALGPAEGNAFNIVSLGDGGQITLEFAMPVFDGPGPDLAVFENSFADTFLELAVVEVSSNGVDFARLPAVSLTQTATQVGGFGSLDATNLHNLAGKYRAGFGTPFDLSVLGAASPLVDVDSIRFVRIIDVVGSINPQYGTLDSQGNLINDPWPTAGAGSGFDLDAVGALHVVPEPPTSFLAGLGVIGVALGGWWRHKRGVAGCREIIRRRIYRLAKLLACRGVYWEVRKDYC